MSALFLLYVRYIFQSELCLHVVEVSRSRLGVCYVVVRNGINELTACIHKLSAAVSTISLIFHI